MKIVNYLIIGGLIFFSSCKSYLDIIPDNIATIDYAFRSRNEAEKYLFTCYAYMPAQGEYDVNASLTAGDEVWWEYPVPAGTSPVSGYSEIARGNQNVISPIGNTWSNGNGSLYKGIRDCNIFLENVASVPDLPLYERERWIAEVQFLKAYYHWLLVQMYGPVPIIDEAPPVSITPADAQVERQTVDSCFSYIVKLIDTAVEKLPPLIEDPLKEMGRITRPVALSIKARILVTAASPLFNGNSDYAGFKDKKGKLLFNPNFDIQKWEKAADACREAIELCESVGLKLYHFSPQLDVYNLSPEMRIRMDLRNRITEKWNSEIIWGDPNSMTLLMQRWSLPPYNQLTSTAYGYGRSESSPPLKIARMFYTKNGVPINEDRTLDFSDYTAIRTSTPEERFQVWPGAKTVRLHFDREPRFYSDLMFDGGVLYGAGNFVDTLSWPLKMKKGEWSGWSGENRRHSVTGYYPKKVVNFLNTMTGTNIRSENAYPWTLMRLADLYLLYSEALNEAYGPGPETYKWIDLVRKRANIPSVEISWNLYSTNPGKYQSRDGLRSIIHQERLIELVFEGGRFWDLRRWKEAEMVLNEPIEGWDVSQSDESYYKIITIFNQKFKKRDYFWPIREADLIINKNLVQNPGW